MKATFNKSTLQVAFQTAAAAVPARTPKLILQNVKLEVSQHGTAQLSATDLEIGVRTDVAGVEVEAVGQVILPVARFGSILRESSDEHLRIETDGQAIVIQGDRSKFRLPSENPAEFPAVATFNEKKYHELPARLLREMIRRTVFAIDSESSRYALGGVLLEMSAEQIVGVGCDGRRLARMQGPAKSVGGHVTDGMAVIVPAKAMQFIERSLSHHSDAGQVVQVAAKGNEILIRTPTATIYSRLVDGRFPKWRDVIPTRPGRSQRIEIVVGQFQAAIKQAAITTSGDSLGVTLAFGGGQVVISGAAADVGQSEVSLPIPHDGPAVSVVLDPQYVIEFLKTLDAESTFTFDIADDGSPVICTTADDYLYLIMPLKK